MTFLRRLLLAVAAGLALAGTGLPQAAQAAPGDDPTEPGGNEPTLAFRSISMGAAPVYGRPQTLSFATNITAQETTATVYLTPTPTSPLTDPIATSNREGAVSWPTAPRFTPGQEYWVRLEVTKETQTVVSARLRFTVAPITSAVVLEQTALAAHERLRVRPVAVVDTGVPATGSITLTSTGTALGTADLVGGVATFHLEPGTRAVAAAYSGGNGWAPSSGGATVAVAKAVVTPTAADPTLETVAGGPVVLEVSLASSEPTYSPGGAYTLLARPAGSTDPADDVVVEEHGYDAGGLRIDLTAWAATRPGRWDLHLLTGETERLAFGSTRVATLDVRRSTTPPVRRVTSKVTGRATRGTRRGVTRVTLAVRVSASRPVAGRLQVRDGRRLVRTVALRGGRAVVRLAGLEPGRHVLRATYAGSPTVAPSTRTWTVTVPRRR